VQGAELKTATKSFEILTLCTFEWRTS